jgi:hypothetical protein
MSGSLKAQLRDKFEQHMDDFKLNDLFYESFLRQNGNHPKICCV